MSVRIVDTVASASVCSSSILHLRGEKIKKGSLTQKKYCVDLLLPRSNGSRQGTNDSR